MNSAFRMSRRFLVGVSAIAATVGPAGAARAQTEVDPASDMRPQIGDCLIFFDGDHEGDVIKPADIKAGAPPVLAWAFDRKKKVARDGSRLNQLLVMRLDPAALGQVERARAADGIVAYSAICTHQQCTVMDWLASKRVAQCPCHQSEYDLAHGARVVAGPAPRPLPALPLKLSDGAPVVSGPFTDRVGGQKL
jgi:rieske iron-sulfur protein